MWDNQAKIRIFTTLASITCLTSLTNSISSGYTTKINRFKKLPNLSKISVPPFPSRKLIRTLTGHSEKVNSLAISADGKSLVSSGGELKLWNLSTGEEVCSIANADSEAIAITPDAQTIVTANPKNINIWRITGKPE